MLPHHSRITKYLFAAFVLIVLVYAYFEARNILYGPQIVLESTEAITVHDELIEIRGTVKNVVEITLTGRPLFIDDTGLFTERLLLVEGLNRFIFEARDKFDNTDRKVLQVIYQPTEDIQRNFRETDTIQEPLEDN
ncbi:MAG: hypothetical protein JKX80_00550 [Candidatus Pacebacteria bacterium]|nr:hypothetical protein [Candidatus Paceibacterota bacterium]